MTGDGLVDIVHISPGKTTYWQNMSHGQFSKQVIMYGPPQFDPDTFSPDRIRLADINGSGTNDLIYFPPSGGFHVYLNHAGNGLCKAQILPSFPKIDQLSSVSILDLFGIGTSCICWLDQAQGSLSKQDLYYIDLALGTKPNFLVMYGNGFGSQADVSYHSSN